MGLLVILAALAPVTVATYPIGDQQVSVFSSVVVEVGFVWSFAVLSRSPGMSDIDMELPRRIEVFVRAVWVIWLIAVMLIPIVIVLGLAPDLDAALYTTVVVLLLLWDAFLLVLLVFRRRPASARVACDGGPDLPGPARQRWAGPACAYADRSTLALPELPPTILTDSWKVSGRVFSPRPE